MVERKEEGEGRSGSYEKLFGTIISYCTQKTEYAYTDVRCEGKALECLFWKYSGV